MLEFKYTILYVDDVSTTLDFYCKAFDFKIKFISPDNSYGELNTGFATLSFATKSHAKLHLKNGFIESNLTNKPFGIEIGFVTDNVEATINQAIKSGAKIVEHPVTTSWGQVIAYVRDPDGFLIEICTPIETN
ncbi:MAG: VOC family protein [Bacteroidetes bacterium]|nr:VOC family protein [Bacteroidota bacterium]